MSAPRPSARSTQRAELQAWFEAVDAPQHAYALIDLASLQSEAPKALRAIRAMQGRSVLQDPREQAALASPWLVHLPPDRAGQHMLERTLDWAGLGACVTWLESHLMPDDLATRLHERTKAELPDSHAVLLRFFDPRVLPELHKALDADQARAFWALGRTWRHIGRDQIVRTIPLTSSAPKEDTFLPPLQLSKRQFDALLAASEVDTVMPELAREAPEAFLALPPEQRASFTQRCLRLADTWHLQAFAHRVMVGVLALKLGEDFHQREPWPAWIAQLSAGKISLVQAIEGATAP